MVTIDNLLEKYRTLSQSERDKGLKFERLMKNFLLTDPVYRGKFSDVWLWNEFPFRVELGTVDLGIDIVCKTVDDEFWAVQCKFYAETSIIDKPAVDTFLATSSKTFGEKNFSLRLWIATSNNLTDNAEIALQNQTPPVVRINLEELRKAAVDWEKLDAGTFGKEAVKNFREPLPHQLDAIAKAHEYFQTHDRGKLIMACGTGKTYTSLKIAEKIYPNGKILFLVPSIALLGQTLYEWATFAEKSFNYICVCSDVTVSNKTEDEILSVNLPLPATTNPDKISRRLENFRGDCMTVVFSTYQSLKQVAKAKIDFDLIICDEAHRTTGYGKDVTPFTAVHDESFIHGKKRLYMTATPKLYMADAKKTAVEKDLTLWSMDDEEIFGEEFFYIGFGEAIRIGKLTDYKVIVLTVDENTIPAALRNAINDKNSAIKTDEALKLIGCINALSKRVVDKSKSLIADDPGLMHTAVAFCPKISYSEYITDIFSEVQQKYCADMPAEDLKSLVEIQVDHIDGTMSADKRDDKLRWLKKPVEGNICRVLSNVRCLSEGVDVPTLDAVLFLSSKKSKVEIVQAVGRALRTARDKKFGYIIIPVVVPANKSPEVVLDSSDFKTVWDVLNALRAHDERIDAEIQRIAVKEDSDRIIVDEPPSIDDNDNDDNYDSDDTSSDTTRQMVLSELLNWNELRNKIYARMVEHVGNRLYWVQWAQRVAEIVERHTNRITELISVEGTARLEFNAFLQAIQQNINPSISTQEAVDMLAQHIVTRPVFEALFENYSFVKSNPVSRAMQEILDKLDKDGMSKDSEIFSRLYDNVREHCRDMGNAEDRQRIIIRLYDNFFRIALKKTAERLGIVYTPVEVVDFILRSVDAVLKKNFGRGLTDKNVHVLDPFAGTGTFLVRLIQSNLIRKKDLLRKYFRELHANEIVLLAYYIAAVNIENAFNDRSDDYQPFEGICFTDTFQAYEQDDNAKGQTDFKQLRDRLKENSERVKEQNRTRIEVIIGNPPYSVGQKSANDNNRNTWYKKLEDRIAVTYTAATAATLKQALYDSYIKAFRWASDRIVDGGIIGFVTNAGWLDGAAMDGLRKCFAKEFSAIYVFNLRGNQRTQGDTSRREGGKIFGSGSRAPIAITILVKNPEHIGDAEIFYRDIGDYLSRDDKLDIIKSTPNVLDESFHPITPNDRGDWINQRGDLFDKFIILGDKKNPDNEQTFFCRYYTNGVKTNRDAWAYNFSRPALESNMRTTIDYYNTHEPTDFDPTKITWIFDTVQDKNRGLKYKFEDAQIVESFYRPFCKSNFYYDQYLIQRVYQMPKSFPTGNEDNLLICVSGVRSSKNLSALIVNKIPDLELVSKSQCFPLYWYEHDVQGSLFGESYHRRDGVSDFILRRAQLLYGNVSKEDVFYYVYGFLHLPGYRKKFSAELKKSLPRIFLISDAKKFWQLSKAGRALAEIHLNYESQPPAQVEVIGTERGAFAVKKMRLSNDKTTLIYNEHITIKNIPPRSFDYVVNGRSPLEWIIDRYQVKTDSASGIVNDPNAWGIEHGNPRYILDLILSAITVSLKTLDIVDSLPDVEFK